MSREHVAPPGVRAVGLALILLPAYAMCVPGATQNSQERTKMERGAVLPATPPRPAGGSYQIVPLADSHLGRPLGGSSDSICCLVVWPDGHMLAAGSGTNDGSIRFWSIPSGKLQRLIDPPEAGTGVRSLALSPDGRILVASYSDGRVLRWHIADAAAQAVPVSSTSAGVASLAFSQNCRLLAADGTDGRSTLWNVTDWRPVAILRGPAQQISDLAFSPDGTILAAASADGSVRLWDVATGQPLGQPWLNPTGPPTRLAYSPDGATLAVGDTGGMVRFWPASLSSWARQACRVANRNLTQQEWRQYLGDAQYHAICPSLT